MVRRRPSNARYRTGGSHEVSLDAWTARGTDDERLGGWDEYPSLSPSTPDEALAHVMDALLPLLPEIEQRVLELHFVAGMSYRDVAIELGWFEGIKKRRPNKRRSQRTAIRGIARLRTLVSDGWARKLSAHRLDGVLDDG